MFLQKRRGLVGEAHCGFSRLPGATSTHFRLFKYWATDEIKQRNSLRCCRAQSGLLHELSIIWGYLHNLWLTWVKCVIMGCKPHHQSSEALISFTTLIGWWNCLSMVGSTNSLPWRQPTKSPYFGLNEHRDPDVAANPDSNKTKRSSPPPSGQGTALW